MAERRNWLPLAGFVVCVVALMSYPMFFAEFPATRDVPWVNWLLFALGLALVVTGIVRAFRARDRYRGRVVGPIFGVASLAVLTFFIFVTEIWSRQMPAAAGAPKVGEQAPDFTLPDPQGRPVRLADVLGRRWALLIFYRGYW